LRWSIGRPPAESEDPGCPPIAAGTLRTTQTALNGISTERSDDHSRNNTHQSKQEDPPKWTDVIVAWFTIIVAVANSVLTGLVFWQIFEARKDSQRQAKETQEQISVAKSAAETAKHNLIASQRAWIKIEDMFILGDGLVFDENGGGARFVVCPKITNLGNDPALKITLNAMLMVAGKANSFPLNERQKIAEKVRSQPFGTGFTLFPNESFPRKNEKWGWSIVLDQDSIDCAKNFSGDFFIMYLLGFIDYTFATDLAHHHQSGFFFDVTHADGSWIKSNKPTVSVEDLRLAISHSDMGWYCD
jgi:hypothetical protein